MASKVAEVVERVIGPAVPAPFEIVDIEWGLRGADWVLSVLVEKSDGAEVTIDETADLSEIVSPLLDTISPDPFPAAGYMLEVASSGAERPLRRLADYERALTAGETVTVSLYQKIDGQKEFVGRLISADGDAIGLEVMDKTRKKMVKIPVSAIAKAQTILLL